MIKPVNAYSPKVLVRGSNSHSDADNPVNRKMEERIAVLNAGGISASMGALSTIVARSYTTNWKNAGLIGLGAASLTMLFVCPRFLYKSGINSYTKEKEIDVFTKEKEVQKKLLTDVNDAIEHNAGTLHDKLENYSKTKFRA